MGPARLALCAILCLSLFGMNARAQIIVAPEPGIDTHQCSKSGTFCKCSPNTLYVDCACGSASNCICGSKGRCLCQNADECNCNEQVCYCGTSAKCSGRGLMFCKDSTGIGGADCNWQDTYQPCTSNCNDNGDDSDDDSGSRGYGSSESAALLTVSSDTVNGAPPVTASEAFCVPDPTSYDTLPDCFKTGTNVSADCQNKYKCKTKFSVAKNPFVIIVPVMAVANILFAAIINRCICPRCQRNLKKEIPANPRLGQDMEDLHLCTCVGGWAIILSPAPFIFLIPIFIISNPQYTLIPAGFSFMILQFVGANTMIFEPRLNRVSHWKHFFCCIPYLWDREPIDSFSNRGAGIWQYSLVMRKRRGENGSMDLPSNCCCSCTPTAQIGARIRVFMDNYLRPIQAEIDAEEEVLRIERERKERERRLARKSRRRERRRRGEMWDTGSASALSSTTTAESSDSPPAASGAASQSRKSGRSSGRHSSGEDSEAPPTYRDATAAKRFCTKCGARTEADGRFCQQCGGPLEASMA